MIFEIHEYKKNIPNGKSGIYMLLGEDEEILYIGKSHNIRGRLGNYFGESSYWKNNHLSDFVELFKYVKIQYVCIQDLKEQEKNLIMSHKPPLNIRFNRELTRRYELMTDEPEEDQTLEEAMKNFRNNN